MKPILLSAAASLLVTAGTIPSSPELGKAEGKCRPQEAGPAFIVNVQGLKDRRGKLKLEVYPANNSDFLADDNILVSAGKTFRRVEEMIPASGPVELCVRVPSAGKFAVSLLHDRDSNRKFNWRSDGIGFAGNAELGWSKPEASEASAVARAGPTPIEIVMNYRRGLNMRPVQ